jgi:hypothetical protein
MGSPLFGLKLSGSMPAHSYDVLAAENRQSVREKDKKLSGLATETPPEGKRFETASCALSLWVIGKMSLFLPTVQRITKAGEILK